MSDQNIFSGPPNWCKDAKATAQGWANTVTGELLVQVGGNFLTRPEYLVYFGIQNPPNGYTYFMDSDGSRLTDADGAYLMETV
jgi:hypothetical protein